MRHLPLGLAALMAAGFLAWPATTPAAAPQTIEFSPQSQIWLEGDSTLHPYRVDVKQWQAKADQAPGRLTDVAFTIPVRAMKSKERALDDNMYKAMKADQHPTIRFSASQARLTARGEAVEVEADGRLTIAGTERPVTVKASGTLTGTTLRLKGSQAVTMSEFGIQPPVLLGGMIRCSDRIVVYYDLVGRVRD